MKPRFLMFSHLQSHRGHEGINPCPPPPPPHPRNTNSFLPTPLSPEKSYPLFPSNATLKVEVLSSPLFENLVRGSTPLPPYIKGGVPTMNLISPN